MALDIEAYYKQYGPMVLRRCRKLLRDEERAADAMQDVFVQLMRHEERIVETAPSNLLMRMATNTCLNIIAADKRHPEDRDEALLQQIASADVDTDSRLHAKFFLGKLFGGEKESTRTIAVMHLLDGMTHEEVAREVGLSVSGVRKRLRGLQEKVAALREVDHV